MLKNRDIIIVGLQPWDTEIGSNCKNIALEFSKHNRVLYVNSPLDRKTVLNNNDKPAIKKRIAVLEGKAEALELIHDGLWVYYPDVVLESINWLKIGFLFNLLNKVNNRRFAGAIKKAISKLDLKDYLLFNDNDIFRSFYLKELLAPKLSIYYSRDYLLGVDYWKYHGKRLEPKLMAKSDICVANSSYLASICKKYNKNSYDVGQGCDIDVFMHAKYTNVPADVSNIPYPRIGYVGALQSLRLDIELIEYLAKTKREWNFVLVGPEDGEFSNSMLHSLKNVYFLGGKDPSLLPAYINSFDVCINPQKINDVTIGNYPRKIDEYLAVGKPVVATLTDSMSVFSDFVNLANNKDDYLNMITSALSTNGEEETAARQQFAAGHTWAASVEKIYDAILKNDRITC